MVFGVKLVKFGEISESAGIFGCISEICREISVIFQVLVLFGVKLVKFGEIREISGFTLY
jgi:hypothetical protein